MTITYIACVVGFFFLAFAIGFCAGVTHEREMTRVEIVKPELTDLQIKQAVARINHEREARAAAQRRSDHDATLANAFTISEADRRKWLYGNFEQDKSNNVFNPEWIKPLMPVTIAIQHCDTRKAERALMDADAYFESSYCAYNNYHVIITAKENLDVLARDGVNYDLLNEKGN